LKTSLDERERELHKVKTAKEETEKVWSRRLLSFQLRRRA